MRRNFIPRQPSPYRQISCETSSVYRDACLRLHVITVEYQGVIQDISPISTETTKQGEFLTFLDSTRTNKTVSRMDKLRLITTTI